MPQAPGTPGASRSLRFAFPSELLPAAERCWEKAAAPAEWELAPRQFQVALERSVAQRFGDALPAMATHEDSEKNPPSLPLKAIAAYLEGLHVSDLALACACSSGNAAAWDHFVAHFRPELYRAARAVAGEANARELADSLYADLYGLRETAGERKSLFDYFHGRSKLSTWLRAILSQRYVDELRRTRRTDALDDDAGESPRTTASAHSAGSAAPDADRERFLAMLQAILSLVLAALDPRDRLRLAYYYVDELTLAHIGKLLGEHEATVSRKLERTRRDVYQRVEAMPRNEKKLNEAQLSQCFDYAREEWPFDLTRVLSVRE
jgi:RNA polymerase sigma-70 factor, ECF subfamily